MLPMIGGNACRRRSSGAYAGTDAPRPSPLRALFFAPARWEKVRRRRAPLERPSGAADDNLPPAPFHLTGAPPMRFAPIDEIMDVKALTGIIRKEPPRIAIARRQAPFGIAGEHHHALHQKTKGR
ncbi:MAG: hypothetical protein AB7E60_06580 [Sphingobium sp.]